MKKKQKNKNIKQLQNLIHANAMQDPPVPAALAKAAPRTVQ